MTPFVGKLPRDIGGAEQPLLAQFDQLEPMAFDDGSQAWNYAFTASSSGIVAARLPDQGVAALLDEHGRWPTFCGTFPMSGRATKVDGGFRLTGRWRFGSGVKETTHVVCGARTTETDSPIWLVLPVTSVCVHETWDALGLRDTASCDYSITDVFVPDRFTFDLARPPLRGGAMFHMPVQAYLTPDHTAITLGCTRRALDECATQAKGKQRLGSAHALDHRPAFVRDLGRAFTQLSAVRSHVRTVLAQMDDVADNDGVDAALFLEARCAATHAAEVAVSVATFAYRNGGAQAVHASNALGTAYRDVMTASQHVHLLDDVYEWRGAKLLS